MREYISTRATIINHLCTDLTPGIIQTGVDVSLPAPAFYVTGPGYLSDPLIKSYSQKLSDRHILVNDEYVLVRVRD